MITHDQSKRADLVIQRCFWSKPCLFVFSSQLDGDYYTCNTGPPLGKPLSGDLSYPGKSF